MAFEALSTSQSEAPENPNKLSQNGLMVAIGVYGFLVLVGFAFGIVTGSDRPKPVAVAAAPKEKEKEQPKAAETPKPQLPQGTGPKMIPNTMPEVKREDPKPESKIVEPKKNPESEPKKKEPEAVASISFEKQVRPILMRYCGECHGNVGKPKGDVDLRTMASIKEYTNPPLLVPGNPQKSGIYDSIVDLRMPSGGKARPGKGEIELIREWIAGGAKPRRRKFPSRKA